ncbi:MAG: hypothetical protein ACE5H2_10350, partial [Terriglobia bacterium]
MHVRVSTGELFYYSHLRAVYRVDGAECDFASFVQVACNKNLPCDESVDPLWLDFAAEPNVMYKIQVAGVMPRWEYCAPYGSLEISIDQLIPPPNDDCSNAIYVTDADIPFRHRQNTPLVTDEAGEPDPSCPSNPSYPNEYNEGSIWYDFVNTSDVPVDVTVSTDGAIWYYESIV